MSPSFALPPVVVGLDIGTTKICALVAGEGETENTLSVLGVGIVPSSGVRRGVVVDVPETVASIKGAIERAGHMAGMDIEGVVAGVTGDHIVSTNRLGSVTVASRGNSISSFDVDRALSAALLEIGRDREVIHSLPRAFSVDEQTGIKKPLGIVGTRLEVESHVVTGQSSVLRNTLGCLDGAGVRAEALVLEPFATAEAVTTRAEREMGALVLDIGGGTSDLAAYLDGSIVYSAALPVGGNHVTRDISIGLSTPFEFAEQLKVGSGAATREMIPHGEALEVMSAGGSARLRIPRALLGEIIEARMRELFELSLSMAMNGGLQGRVPGGLILSGGGALLPGALELAGHIFGLPVRLGVPEGLSGWSEPVSSPQFSTAVGLCRIGLEQKKALARRAASVPIPSSGARRVWGQLAFNSVMARHVAPPTPATPEISAPAPEDAHAPKTETPAPKPEAAHEEFPAQIRFAPSAPAPSAPAPSAPTPENAPPPPTQLNGTEPAPAPVPAELPAPLLVPATATAPVPTTVENPSPATNELEDQRARVGDLLPRIDAAKADVERAKDAPLPSPEPIAPEPKVSWWSRLKRFAGFEEE